MLRIKANDRKLTENCIDRVHGDLVLGRITNETLGVSEGNVRGGGAVTLVIRNDLNTVMLPHTNAGVSSTKVDTDSRPVLGHGETKEADKTTQTETVAQTLTERETQRERRGSKRVKIQIYKHGLALSFYGQSRLREASI